MHDFKNYYSDPGPFAVTTGLKGLEMNYTKLIADIFNNSIVDLLSIPEHVKCKAQFNKLIMGETGQRMEIMETLVNETLAANTISEWYNISLQMIAILNSSEVNNFKQEVENLYGNCSWFGKYMTEGLKGDVDDDWQDAADDVEMVEGYLSGLATKIPPIVTALQSQVVPALRCTDLYVDGRITKLDLKRCFHSFPLQNGMEDIQSLAIGYDTMYSHITTGLLESLDMIYGSFREVLR